MRQNGGLWGSETQPWESSRQIAALPWEHWAVYLSGWRRRRWWWRRGGVGGVVVHMHFSSVSPPLLHPPHTHTHVSPRVLLMYTGHESSLIKIRVGTGQERGKGERFRLAAS